MEGIVANIILKDNIISVATLINIHNPQPGRAGTKKVKMLD